MDNTTILVIYHSQGGQTRRMAESVAAGAEVIDNVQAILKPAGTAGLQDLLQCDGLAVGSPEYFGYMAGMVKDFFDRTYTDARGCREVFKKPYVAFVCAGNDGRGALAAIERICIGYQFKKVYEPVLACGPLDGAVLDKCRELGMTLAAGCEAGIY